MFNNKTKKEAVERLKSEMSSYEKARKDLERSAVRLHNRRESSIALIKEIEKYINRLANTPKEFEKNVSEINVNIAGFEALTQIEYDEELIVKIGGGGAALGVGSGVAVAAMGPTVAMSIATTFGTASTGAAIAGLQGAAATNAALAWLGGGALAAGGGGMAAGNAFLALAGPIGWALGAIGLVGGGLFANKKNKEAAIKAEDERVKLKASRKNLEAVNYNIKRLRQSTKEISKLLNESFVQFVEETRSVTSYEQFTDEHKHELRAIINNTLSLSKLFMEDVGDGNSQEI